MQETRVRSLVGEDPLEKEMATHSSIIVWRISRTKEPGGLQSMGSQRLRQGLATKQQQQKVLTFKFCFIYMIVSLVFVIYYQLVSYPPKDYLWIIRSTERHSQILMEKLS